MNLKSVSVYIVSNIQSALMCRAIIANGDDIKLCIIECRYLSLKCTKCVLYTALNVYDLIILQAHWLGQTLMIY